MLIRPLPGTVLPAADNPPFTPLYPIPDAENFPPSRYGDRYERIFPASMPVATVEVEAIIIEDGDEPWLLDNE